MTDSSAEETWESRYRDVDRVWSGKPNTVLVDVAGDLPVGRALDLGCGEGADSVWLAQHGWQVTAIDVSTTAMERGAQAAADAGIPAERIRWARQDLATWMPQEQYDLVSAFFLHSPADLPREEVLRRASGAVAPSSHLLIVGHAAPPPWAMDHHHDDGEVHQDVREFPTPTEQLAELALPETEWEVQLAETRGREAIGPNGEQAVLQDVVVLVRRR